MRDGEFASARVLWSHGQTIWTVSNIYAAGPDGRVSEGARAIEALRIFYDLDMMFDNLRAARARARKGIFVSDEIRKRLENPPATRKTTAHLEVRAINNPVWSAEQRYVQQHGSFVLNGFMEKLFDELFPAAN